MVRNFDNIRQDESSALVGTKVFKKSVNLQNQNELRKLYMAY